MAWQNFIRYLTLTPSPLASGLYHSRDEFVKGALLPLVTPFKDGIKMEVCQSWLFSSQRLFRRADAAGNSINPVDVFVQPSERNDASQGGITKALVEMKGTAVLKNGKRWDNYYA